MFVTAVFGKICPIAIFGLVISKLPPVLTFQGLQGQRCFDPWRPFWGLQLFANTQAKFSFPVVLFIFVISFHTSF